MTAQWALAMMGDVRDVPLQAVAEEIVDRFGEGAASESEVKQLAAFRQKLRHGTPMDALEGPLRTLSHDGYLRGAIVAMASYLARSPRPDVALSLARELMDAVDPRLGVNLARSILVLPALDQRRHDPAGPYCAANQLLGENLLEGGDPQGALRHFEAVLSVDVDDSRALRGWSSASQALERKGITAQHRSRGLALLDGLDELELAGGFGTDRYELGRPLGRGRHAVVYQAYDRHVGREVAIKRLLDPDAQRHAGIPTKILQARFFAEARTLARVRSPYVVALLDAVPKHRFIALQLCYGGNMRLAMRRGLLGPDDLDRVGRQLHSALEAVHAAGAIHRDVKPANILVRARKHGSPVALADFGLAVGREGGKVGGRAGTLRYLAPELRKGNQATPASDWFSAAVVLLELARAPAPLPEAFDRIDGELDAVQYVPELPDPWTTRLRSLLSSDPDARAW